jgi:threonine dehydratase
VKTKIAKRTQEVIDIKRFSCNEWDALLAPAADGAVRVAIGAAAPRVIGPTISHDRAVRRRQTRYGIARSSWSMAMSAEIPVLADIQRAAERLADVAVRTPLLTSEVLDARTGARVLLKAEPLQRTGSFKLRGAYNTIAQLEADSVVAYSSGNHAQGVAAAARMLGRRATIVMPSDAPAAKIEGTRAHGAEVVLYDRLREEREAIGERIASDQGAALIRPYDDPRIVAGQGTVGLEIAEDSAALGLVPDLALVPCGGGGLVAGCAIALAERCPGIEVFAVEPAGFDDTRRSLEAGERIANAPGASSICDALLVATPGALTFEISRRLLAGGLVVDDAEVLHAMAFAFRHLKLVVEPGGAVALAALLAGRLDVAGRTVAVVLSGGNVDAWRYVQALGEALP